MDTGQTILYIIVLIFSVVLHEVAHGYAADAMGDRTARYAGRLTINPIPHLDLFGSVILPALLVFSGAPFLVGWAKPVPFNLSNIRNKRWGASLIALAGPAANLSLAIIFAVILRFREALELSSSLTEVFMTVVLVNVVLMIFNLMPVPPLDGHHVLFDIFQGPRYAGLRFFMQKNQLIFILLALFVLWPLLTPIVFAISGWLVS